MRRILLIVLSLTLALSPLFSASASTPFDLDYIRNSDYIKNELIRIEENETGVFVYNNFAVHDLAIDFDQESDEYYSYADFDIAVFEEDDGTLPLLRLWFTLWTDEKKYDVSSLTIVGHQNQYTFSDLYDEEFFSEDKGDYSQDVLVLFDFGSMQCLSELMRLRQLMKASSDWHDFKVKVIFHGTEDLVTELGDNFWNIFDVYIDLYLNSNGSVNLRDFEGSPMEVSPVS